MIRRLLAATALSASVLTATPAFAAPQQDQPICLDFYYVLIDGTPINIRYCFDVPPGARSAVS